MVEKAAALFPQIFRPEIPDSGKVFSYTFGTAEFAQLAISELNPDKCKSFSRITMSANVHHSLGVGPVGIDEHFPICKCLTPASVFAHAFVRLSLGDFTEDVKEAVEKLGKYLEEEAKHVSCISKMLGVKQKELTETQILLVYAHHLFEPLLPHAELLVDKDASECPFCPEKKDTVKSGSPAFGVPGMWHGRADVVIKHGKVQQTVTVTQGASASSDELAGKRQRMDDEEQETENYRTGSVEVKNDLNWTVTSAREQDQQPIPQLLSRTIVNAFLVAKEKENFKKFFIPSFLVTPKGVMIVMYNISSDSLITQVDCRPVVFDKKLYLRSVFTIWLALNFDKFCLDKSVEAIEKFLKPCGFRENAVKNDVLKSYDKEVQEDIEERQGEDEAYQTCVDDEARIVSWDFFTYYKT